MPPGYPDQGHGVAGTQVPNACLFRLLKELWNYWLSPVVASEVRVSTDLSGSWKAVTELGRSGVHSARCWVLRQHTLFLVWCLRTVEWMRASLWSSC